MVTLNGHVLCAIDTETTGLVPGYHDIIEIAVVPLDEYLKPIQMLPFVTFIRPKDRYPDSWTQGAYEQHGISKTVLLESGLEPHRASDLFEEWVAKMNLAPGKKIAPLCKNWPFDKAFIADWLGPKTLDALFWYQARDLGPVVHFINDVAEFNHQKPPFPQQSLQAVRGALKIPPNKAHRALDDALTLAECYRRCVVGEVPGRDER